MYELNFLRPALETLLGKEASGLSSNTVSRLRQGWEQKNDFKHDLETDDQLQEIA